LERGGIVRNSERRSEREGELKIKLEKKRKRVK
jgi:hypothetical protein